MIKLLDNGALLPTPSPPLVQWRHIVCLKLVMVGILKPQTLANSVNQNFVLESWLLDIYWHIPGRRQLLEQRG